MQLNKYISMLWVFFSVLGAFVMSFKLVAFAYTCFFLANLLGILHGRQINDNYQITLQFVFFISSCIGVYKWIIT